MLRRPANRQPPGGFPALLRHGDPLLSAQVLSRQALRVGTDFLRRPLGHDLPAVLAGPGPHVDDPVRRPHGFLVVLHNDHRIPKVPHALQRGDQLRVVPLVQPDAGLVQDVHHAHQRAADLRRQADPLGFAAAEGARPAGQRQVAQPHVPKEPEPRVDLL